MSNERSVRRRSLIAFAVLLPVVIWTSAHEDFASARQNHLGAKLLLVDDGGYGILREYQRDSFGETFAVDLVQPDFVALADAFGVPVRSTAPETLGEDLAWALAEEGPAVVVLRTKLEMWTPTA